MRQHVNGETVEREREMNRKTELAEKKKLSGETEREKKERDKVIG